MKKGTIKGLKPFNSVIQICPVCGRVDVYDGDNHDCGTELAKQENNDMREENN